MNYLPAGLTDLNIEFFEKNGAPFVLQNGQVLPYQKSKEGQNAIHKDMMDHIDLVLELSKAETSLKGYELEKKWIICRFGGFNNIPDFEESTGKFFTEYHPCPNRATCKFSGIICKIPEGPGGRLTHKELETILIIAQGDISKAAADKMGVTYNTLKTYLKRVHKKLGAHNRADIVNFAHQNNIV